MCCFFPFLSFLLCGLVGVGRVGTARLRARGLRGRPREWAPRDVPAPGSRRPRGCGRPARAPPLGYAASPEEGAPEERGTVRLGVPGRIGDWGRLRAWRLDHRAAFEGAGTSSGLHWVTDARIQENRGGEGKKRRGVGSRTAGLGAASPLARQVTPSESPPRRTPNWTL